MSALRLGMQVFLSRDLHFAGRIDWPVQKSFPLLPG